MELTSEGEITSGKSCTMTELEETGIVKFYGSILTVYDKPALDRLCGGLRRTERSDACQRRDSREVT
jgi:hypothetical protein